MSALSPHGCRLCMVVDLLPSSSWSPVWAPLFWWFLTRDCSFCTTQSVITPCYESQHSGVVCQLKMLCHGKWSISFVNVMLLCFSFIKENDQSCQSQTMKILLVYSQDDPVDPVDVALVIDGAEVLTKCENKTKACLLLMGLICALNLQ